jgi:antagonist of KipI
MPDAAGTIVVLQPGMLTTVQDLGRVGLMRFGVSPCGALDQAALILGNRLLGNEPNEAGLEITLLGPTLVFSGSAFIALTGADLGARLNGDDLPQWQPVAVGPGDELAFRRSWTRGSGVRAYLCVAGGFAVEPVLGSRSTDLWGHFGGYEGRALRSGDEIRLRGARWSPRAILGRRLANEVPSYASEMAIRVVLGPQVDRFTDEGIATFLGSTFAVSVKADRTGVRLQGPVITQASGADLLSEGNAHGAVQVPGDGQPIVLLAARGTIGGYLKIATVVGADLDHFAQLAPGNTVQFAAVTPEEARGSRLAYLESLGPTAVVAAAG